MRKTTARDIRVLSFLPAALLGCGSIEGGSGGISAEAAPAEIAKAVCPKAYTCCMTDQLMNNDLAGTDEASCEAKTTEGFHKNLDGILASQKKGRVVYDGNKLAACLATIRSSSCGALNTTNHFSGIPGCATFVQPQVSAGGTCDFDWECIDGWCRDHACTAFAAAGEACGDKARCGKDLVCDATAHTCMTATDQRGAPGATPPAACFYASACAIGGAARPTAAGVMVLAALLAGLRRRRRGR